MLKLLQGHVLYECGWLLAMIARGLISNYHKVFAPTDDLPTGTDRLGQKGLPPCDVRFP